MFQGTWHLYNTFPSAYQLQSTLIKYQIWVGGTLEVGMEGGYGGWISIHGFIALFFHYKRLKLDLYCI